MAEYYVSKRKLCASFEKNAAQFDSVEDAEYAAWLLGMCPCEDVAEVKHGKWLTPQNDTIRGQKFTCSICGKIAYCPQPTRLKNWVKHCNYEYCPHCGAKMDGKGEQQ